jgi:hypothetical protein
MKLPQYKRITKSDYPTDSQTVVEKLALTINTGFDNMLELANKKISLSDNILCSVRTITIIVDSAGTPTGTASFSLDFTGRVLGVQVINAINLTNINIFPTGTPFISYSQTQSGVTMKNITGLTSKDNWQLTVVAYGS